MKAILTVTCLLVSTSLRAEPVFRIEVGNDYKQYSQSDLQRRVWELERAVHQLQARIFQLEMEKPKVATADSWLCKVNAMGDTHVGTGGSKAVATANAISACMAARGGDGFFCKNASCEQ